MKKPIILFFLVLISNYSFCQDTLTVVEKTIKINGLSNEIEYYGFAKGDQVIFNMTVENRKDIKNISISEYPNSVKFADYSRKDIRNKVINIPRNAVYVFDYNNSNLSGRIVNIKIQRIPESEKTEQFNTNVRWVNSIDTTYSAKENTYLASSDTSIVPVLNSTIQVHSKTNMDSPNKIFINFTIPANTIRWTYWIGVGKEGQEAFQKDEANFSKSGTKILESMNPLVGLAFGLITMSHAQIGESVKYYFMPTVLDAQRFMAGQQFTLFKNGDVITDFGLMNYATRNNTTYFLGLQNDNLMQGINVNVKIIAIVVNNKYQTVAEKTPIYTNKLIPVIMN